MLLERMTLTNFRCFGPEPQTIWFSSGVTALVGTNGSGKTAVMLALLRMFGISSELKMVRRQDFHVPLNEQSTPEKRTLSIEAVFTFPELDLDDEDASDAAGVPEFFHQMTNDDEGKMKCRFRMEANWTDDGSTDGTVEMPKLFAIRTMQPNFTEADCSALQPKDRARIQMLYIPAIRDGVTQMSLFLRSRLWRAIKWSDNLKDTLETAGTQLNDAFGNEPGVKAIADILKPKWQSLHSAGTDAEPIFRPVDNRLQEFIRKTEVLFRPDESGGVRSLEELSDGQRSLFHLAMTAAALDIENAIASGKHQDVFKQEDVSLPSLTIFAVEEPENNLAPFFLSRIINQVREMTRSERAQAIVSSHSASILYRIDPEDVRYFRINVPNRTAQIQSIRLPDDAEEASKYVREAIRAYPELYFARFVVLGEGSSEEVVLPRIAEAMNLPLDRSFVAIVPLGGRHVNHFWRLLNELGIPHATLLDLDIGREGGGWGRIKTACSQLIANGVDPTLLFGKSFENKSVDELMHKFDGFSLGDSAKFDCWQKRLQKHGVFYCAPLDLDMSMFQALKESYQAPEEGMRGPANRGDAKLAVLGENSDGAPYDDSMNEHFLWYRFLFLNRSKPGTHVRVLGNVSNQVLAERAPDELKALLKHVQSAVFGDESEGNNDSSDGDANGTEANNRDAVEEDC